MPTYSYRCTECGTAFDAHQAFSDDALTVCPTCGGKLRKLFNTVGVTFNGSGFYRTDSRAAATSSSSESSTSSSPPSSGKAASTTSTSSSGGGASSE